MQEIGWAGLDIIPNFDARRLDRDVDRAMLTSGRRGGVRFGDEAGKAAGSRFSSRFRTAAKVGLLGLGVGTFAFLRESRDEASALNESVNAVKVTYGKQAKAVLSLGDTSAERLRLSTSEFNKLAVRFSNFSKIVSGGSGKKVVKTLDDLSQRASDFASVMDLDVNEAATLFQSGLAGETEPLRRFGIDMSAAAVEAFAYANGIAETGKKLTESEKVQARYGILMKETKKTQGDSARTADEYANASRRLDTQVDNIQAKLGSLLLPMLADVASFTSKKVIPAFEDFSDWLSKTGVPALKDFSKKAKPFLTDFLEDARDLAKEIIPFVETLVDKFNALPDGVKKGLLIGAGAVTLSKLLGGGGGKSGGLISGGRGTLLGAVRGAVVDQSGKLIADRLLAKFQRPLPVFVVNEGFGPGGGVGGKGGKVAGVAGKFGIVGAVAAPAAIGLEKLHDFHRGDDKNGLASLGGGGINRWLDDAIGKTDRHNKQLSATQKQWIDARLASQDYAFQVKNGIPRSALTTVTNWPLHNRYAREYLATILDIRGAHMDTRLDRAGGTPNATPGSGINSRGVTQNFYGDIRPNDVKEFQRWSQRKSIAAASDGRPQR